MKDRLNFRRMQVSSELSLNGKIFVEFIGLIYLSYVKKKMQDAGLFEKWTLQGLLDELDTIELFESPDHGRLLGEVTKKQEEIYNALGIRSTLVINSGDAGYNEGSQQPGRKNTRTGFLQIITEVFSNETKSTHRRR